MPQNIPVITTGRLLLREWREEDLPAWCALNADPVVREYFPNLLTVEESKAAVDRFSRHFDEHGFGLWAVEVPGVAPFIGFVGMMHVSFPASFAPAVETGWRIAKEYWGQGYATEAALASLRFGFEEIELPQIVAFTAVANHRSRRVMERIGMTHSPEEDFNHPALVPGHPLERHVLYRARRDARPPLA